MRHWIEFLQNERWKWPALICSYFTCNNFLFSLPLSVSVKNFVFITLRKGELLLELGLRQSTAEKLFDEVLWLTEEIVRMIIDQNHSHTEMMRSLKQSVWLIGANPAWFHIIQGSLNYNDLISGLQESRTHITMFSVIILTVSICLSLSCLPQAASGLVVNSLINNNLIIDCFHHELLN